MNKWILSIIVNSFFLAGSLLGLTFSVIYGYYPAEKALQTASCQISYCRYVDQCGDRDNVHKLEENCWLTIFNAHLTYNNENITKEMVYDADSIGLCDKNIITCYYVLPNIYETLTIYRLSNMALQIMMLSLFSLFSFIFLLIIGYSIYRLKTTPIVNIDYFSRNYN